MNKVFWDMEFTGLHQRTTLMSIGLVDAFGDTFYAELTDYDQTQINDWLRENVLANFTLGDQPEGQVVVVQDELSLCKATTLRGTRAQVKAALTAWLSNEETRKGKVQMWSDCLAYDWVLFNDLLADYTNGYPQLPEIVHYIPMDICPLFELKAIDPDINREQYCEFGPTAAKHNALHDARVIQRCYYKLTD